jgi:NTE family protein
VQSAARRLPSPAMPWLTKFGVGLHCHVRSGCKSDMARLARYLIGRAVGIALSGGGARGCGHIGVIRALREAGLPIDLVGGTSMGAIIAAGIALEWDDIELRDRVHDAFVRSDPVSDYGFPFVSLTKGRKVARRLREHFGDARVEDLWRPYFAVASNLTTGRILVQREGVLWCALKASAAIPGLMPPHIEAGEVLVDGAVMNNLPADIMRGFRRGPVIGVDVARYQNLRAIGDDEQTMSRRWLFPRDQRDAPDIVSLLLRSAMVTSDAQAKICRSQADLLLEPPLQDIDMRDWKAIDRAIDAGYHYAAEKLRDENVLGQYLR